MQLALVADAAVAQVFIQAKQIQGQPLPAGSPFTQVYGLVKLVASLLPLAACSMLGVAVGVAEYPLIRQVIRFKVRPAFPPMVRLAGVVAQVLLVRMPPEQEQQAAGPISAAVLLAALAVQPDLRVRLAQVKHLSLALTVPMAAVAAVPARLHPAVTAVLAASLAAVVVAVVLRKPGPRPALVALVAMALFILWSGK